MAMVQAGMGLSRIVLLAGAGFTGSVVLRNGDLLSDFLKEIQVILRENGYGDGAGNTISAVTKEVNKASMEVRELLSNSITILHIDPGKTVISALMAPAAAAGVLGYGYMWWKAAKRHLTQRIQRVDDRLDEQREISGQIRDEVTGARLKLENIGSEMEKIRELACGLNGKLDSIQEKQDNSLDGVKYLVRFIEERGGRLPDRLEGLQGTARRIREQQGKLPGLGLQVLAIESANCGSRVVHVQSTSVNAAS